MQIIDLSLSELLIHIKNRKISVYEALSACLDRIDAVEHKVGALLYINRENALKKARQMDDKGPDPEKPLWGAPLIIKDALSTKKIPTTAASRILENFVPFYDAFAVKQLKDAGALIIGKGNMDEFAMGSTTENSAFKITHNPWDFEKIPGGSSGGSAAAIAARECFGALGSDTGGSIRQPAAFCGCVGIKPTYGRVSRYGLFAFASSLDQIGPMSKNVEDGARILNIIARHDWRDNTCSTEPVQEYLPVPQESEKPFAKTVIGIPQKEFLIGLDEDTSQAFNETISILENLGAQILAIPLPKSDMAIATYYIVAMAEASSNLARYDGVRYGRRSPDSKTVDDLYVNSRSEGFGTEVKRRIMLGSYILSAGYYDAYFKKAAQTRRIIYNQYLSVLSRCNAILMPVSPITAWPLGENITDPLKTYLMDAFTLPVNLAGLPAISFPTCIGKNSGMPVGMQLIGKHFEEKQLIQYAYLLEQYLPKMKFPSLN